jgi:hypothetical protein
MIDKFLFDDQGNYKGRLSDSPLERGKYGGLPATGELMWIVGPPLLVIALFLFLTIGPIIFGVAMLASFFQHGEKSAFQCFKETGMLLCMFVSDYGPTYTIS